MKQAANAKDSLLTLAALGVIAYVFETIGHEALGHGSACLALGGQVEVIAPLWMRCSVTSKIITAAGPCFNLLAAAALGVVVYRRTRLTTFAFLLWFGCAFNALVACGYLMVGGATTFGDWNVLLAPITPAWTWRAAALGFGLAAYLASLRVLSHLYGRLVAADGFAKPVLWPRLLVPGVAAALVACLAELAAGQRHAAGFGLPLACTIVPALTLLSMQPEHHRPGQVHEPIGLPFSVALVVAALLIATLFVGMVGRLGGLLS